MKYFKNQTKNSADFYVYGEISNDKSEEWWSTDTMIDPMDVKAELDELKDAGITELNICINSPGGSVFGASTIVSLLKRFKQDTGAQIHAYVDGLCASAATYLAMVADDLNVYQNSILMIHKPMTISWGNANDLQKDIDTLNTIEDNMMLPMYMSKAKESITLEDMKSAVGAETWFTGDVNDIAYIGNFFTVNLLDEVKAVAACADSKLLKNYKHVPDKLTHEVEPIPEPDDSITSQADESENDTTQKVDYSPFESVIKTLKGEESNEQEVNDREA